MNEFDVSGFTGLNGNIVGTPILDENYNLEFGSPGVDSGNSAAVGLGLIDLNGEARVQDGNGDGVAVVNIGATESTFGDSSGQEDPPSDQGNIDATNPLSFNSWGSGFNATFEYEITESDTAGGSVREWRVDVGTTGSVQITNAWMSGYNAGITSSVGPDFYTITNQGQSYVQELGVGDVLTFTVQGQGSGLEDSGLFLNFVSLTQTLPATGTCDSPTPVTLPFSFDGQGEFCWEVTGTVDYVNSWSLDSVFINGEEYTNLWSNTLPAQVDGKYTILYNSAVSWGHFEITGAN